MERISKLLETAFERYFNTLSKFGYMNLNNVNKLLVLSFLEDLLTSELSYYVTDNDYKVIISSIECLIGTTCLIDFPTYETFDSLIHTTNVTSKYRVTENEITRATENDRLREKEIKD